MRKKMIGRRWAPHGHRGAPRMHGRPYGPPVPPPFLALGLLAAAFALGRISGAKRRFGRPWGPSAHGCAGRTGRAWHRGPHRGEEPPVIV